MAALWLLAAARVPLFPDEMYYWEWSRRLAAGYYDHPPAIAWLIALGTAVLGDSPLGVRLLPVTSGLLAVAATASIARRLAGPGAALRATALLPALPLITGASVLATPDALLLGTTAGSLYAVVRAIEAHGAGRRGLPWWLLAGLLLGAAGLSKYTAVLLPLGIGVALVLTPRLRGALASPGPWIAAAVAALVVAPVVLWNAGHEWVSFRFQLGHGLGASRGGSALAREGSLLAGQLFVVTPILLLFLGAAVIRSLRSGADARARLLAWVAATIAVFFVASALRKPAEANWLAAAYLPASALLAAWPLGPTARRWFRAGALLAAGATTLLVLHLATPLLPLPREPQVVANAFGWAPVAAAAARAAGRAGEGRVFVAANRYQEAAAMAFHLPGHPDTYALNLESRTNQYDLWPRFPDVACPGDGLVLVTPAGSGQERAATTALAPLFDRMAVTETVERRMPALGGEGRVVDSVRIRLLSGWTGAWPAAPALSGASAGSRCRS